MAIKTPFLAVDGIIKLFDYEENFKGIVLIERKNEPKGLALPGGFVEVGETVEDALKREMKEEVNLDIEILNLFGVYSNPTRDKRFHVVSTVFVCKAYGEPMASSDAKKTYIYKIEDIPFEKLVFDHEKILRDFINKF